MLTIEQKRQFSDILDSLGEELDITESQYDAAVRSYKAVGEWLSDPESILAPYKPEIRPQGSFILGTMIKAIHEKDDLDIDLVCELTGKRQRWTQYDLKQVVGDRLRMNKTYKGMLEPEGRRCWTLKYSDTANYHMDILPSLVNSDYNVLLERSFSASVAFEDYDLLAIRITDKLHPYYRVDTSPESWYKSNPFGYAKWFFNVAAIEERKILELSASVQPVPKYQKSKLPLQRVVQILKRHRDMMFNGSEDKPISIIITTLAAKAYKKESSVWDALVNIVSDMENHIENRYDYNLGKRVKWVANPVNPTENFADKWVEHPIREINFYKWIEQVKQDIQTMGNQQGIHLICESMKKPFGENVVIKAISSQAEKSYQTREQGNMRMSTGSGILGTVGSVITKSHNFHGNN